MDDLSTSFSNEPLSSEPGTSCVPYGWFIVCVRDNLPLSILMAVYYYVPFVLALLITIMLLVRRTTTMLLAQFWIVFLAVLNEGILKNIIRQPRPPDSCDCTYGMPSGHSLVSMAFLVWIVLECLFDEPMSSYHKRRNGIWRSLSTFVAFITLGPVLYSRVHLHYHTALQAIGGALGAVLSIGWFILLYCFVSRRHYLDMLVLSKPFQFLKFRNDYRPSLEMIYTSVNTDQDARFT